MADRYWVGGTGTWNTTSTTNWSASSGGPSGASVPTVSDNVIFDQAATYTVTMTGALACLNITVSAGVVTFATGTTPTLNVRGSWSTIAGTVWNSTGVVTFTSTTAATVTSGGITINAPFTFNGTGGTWTLQDNLTLANTLTTTLTAGTLALDSFTLKTGLFNSSGTTARTLNFGTGNITLNPSTAVTMWNTATVTSLTVSGTPLVITQGSGAVTKTISTGALSQANSISFQLNDTAGTIAFTASNVVRDLTVNGTFTLSNIAITIYGNYTYTAGTLTAGTNAWTFGATSGTKTISTGATTHDFPFTINGTGGTFQLATNLTLGATRVLTLTNGTFDQNAKTITASGITVVTGSVTVNNLNVSQAITHTSGTLTLGTAATTGTYTLNGGTLSLSSFTLTMPSFASSVSIARTLAFGTGQLTLTGNNSTLFNISNASSFTTTGTVYVNSTYTGAVGTRTFVTGFSEAQAAGYDVKTSGSSGIIIGATATDTVALTGSYNNFDLTGLSCTISNTARTIYGSFVVPGVSGTLTAGTLATTFAGAGSETITTNGRTLDFPITFNATGTFSLSDALTVGSTRTVTLTAGTLSLQSFTLSCGIFSGTGTTARTLAFGTGQLTLVGNAATIFDVTTATNYSTTGTVKIVSTYTGATGTRTFVTGFTEAQSAGYNVNTSGSTGITFGTTATDTVAFTGNFNDFNLTGLTNTLSNTARTIYGSFTIPASGGTLTAGALVTTFAVSTTKTLTTNGRALGFPITFNGTGTFQLAGVVSLTNTLTTTLTAGTLDLNGFTLSTGLFSSSNANARTIAFNGGQIAISGNAANPQLDIGNATNFAWTGTPYFNLTYAGATGTRVISLGSTTQGTFGLGNAFDVSVTGSSGIVLGTGTDTINVQGFVNDLNLTGMGFTFANSARTIFGNFTIPSTGGSISGGSFTTTVVNNSSKTIDVNRAYPTLTLGTTGITTGTYVLANNLTVGPGTFGVFTLVSGTLDLNDKSVTALQITLSSTSTKSINFRTSSVITVNNDNNALWDAGTTGGTNFSWTGTARIFASYTGAFSTRRLVFGQTPEQSTFDIVFASTVQANTFTIAPSTDGIDIQGNVKTINYTGTTNIIRGPDATQGRTVFGNYITPATGGSFDSSGTPIIFAGSSGTSTITTNGRTSPVPFNINAAGKTIQQVGATTLTQPLTLTAGTLDLNNATFTATTFSSTNTNVRSILFGTSGQLNLTSSGATIVDIATATNFTWTGNSKIVSTYASSVGTRTFTIGNTAAINSAYAFDVIVGTGAGINLSASATDSVALTGIYNNVDLRGLASILTNTARSIAGSFRISSTGGTYTAGTAVTTFIGNTSTYTVDTARRVLDFPFTFNGSATWNIANTFTSGSSTTVSTRTLTLTSGNVSFSNVQINCGQFSSTNTNSRNLDFGANGEIRIVNINTTLLDFTVANNFTYSGTPRIYSPATGGAATTRTFNFGGTSGATPNNVFNVSFGAAPTTGLVITPGNDSIALTGQYRDFDLTSITNAIITNTTKYIHGNTTVPAGATWGQSTAETIFTPAPNTTITINANTTLGFPIRINGAGTVQLQSNLIMGATRTFTLDQGTLDLNAKIVSANSFSSSSSNNRSIAFGTSGNGAIALGNSTTIWNTTIGTNFTWTGDFRVDSTAPISGTRTINFGTIAEEYAPNVKVTLGTAGFNLGTATSTVAISGNVGGLDLTGFAGTLTNLARNVHGDLTFPATGGTFTAGATATTLAATSGTKRITYNNRTIDFPITINGTSGTFVANGNILLGATRTLTLTNGTFDANSANITASTITVVTGNVTVSNLSTTLTVTHTSGNLNLNSNTSTGDYTLTSGYLNLNNYLITTRTFSSSGSGVRGINFGDTGKMQLSANATVTYWNTGTPTNFTYTGNSNIETVGGGNATKTISTGPLSQSQAMNWTLKDDAGSYISLSAPIVFRNLTLNGPFALNNLATTIYGDYKYNSTFTDGYQSVYFDGSDYFDVGTNTAFAFGTGDFTVEGWVYLTSAASTRLATNRRPLNVQAGSWGLNLSATTMSFTEVVTGEPGPTATFSSIQNQWAHVAASRTSGTTSLFVNGTQVASAAQTTNFNSTAYPLLIATSPSENFITGYVSNLRIVKGTGLYTGAFTPSTTPLTAVANTVLLTCRSNLPNDLSNNSFNITISGNAGASYFNPFNSANGTALSSGTAVWTFASPNTQTITSNSFIHDFPFTFAGTGSGKVLLEDNLTLGGTRTTTLTSGTLDLNDKVLRTGIFSSTNSNARTIGFANTGKISLISNAATTLWNTSTPTNFTYTGNSNIETVSTAAVSRNMNTGLMSESQAMNWNLLNTAGTTLFSSAGNGIKNLTVNGTFTFDNSPITIYGDYNYITATAVNSGPYIWTFAGTGTQNISAGSITYNFPWTFNGVGGNFILQSNTTIAFGQTTTLANGTFDLNGYNYTTGLFVTNEGTKTLQFDGGKLTISGSGATAFNNANNTGFNIIANGNSVISLTSSTAKTFAGNNVVYPVVLDQGGTGTLTVTGNNTFQDITASISSTANSTILLTANTTTTVNNFTLSGTASFEPTLNSTVEYSRANIFRTTTGNTIHSGADYIQCRNIGFLPYSVDGSDYLRWWVGANSISLNNNMGAVFQTYDANTSPKVYIVEANTAWTVPDDFNVSNNAIHMFGAGGAGGGGSYTGGDSFGGGGGGGGGYSKITNLYAVKNQKLNLEIGIGGDISLAANGGNTKLISWYGVYNAGGGQNATGGTGTAVGSKVIGGTGGSGLTFNGGNGGNGDFNDGSTDSFSGGGGGGGAGGPLGVGGTGGVGVGYSGILQDQPNAGGGGGGNGGGTNGSNGTVTTGSNPGIGGSGGQNASGFGRGVGSSGNPTTSFSGGGGAGAGSTTTTGSGAGSGGIDVLNSFGGGSGSGGGASRGNSISRATGIPGIYGGGGGGGGASRLNTATTYLGAGSSGSNGGIIIVYKPSTVPNSNGSIFTLF